MTGSNLLELLGRARVLMQREAERLHDAGRCLMWWQHRAADVLAEGNASEARDLIQAAALLLPSNDNGGEAPGVAEWQRDVGLQHTVDGQALAVGFIRQAATLLEQARGLLPQDSIRGRFADFEAELRLTADGIEGIHAKA